MVDGLELPSSYNAAVDFIDEAPAAETKVAFIDRTGAHTYGELKRLVARTGAAMAGLGVPREARVAIAMLDTVDFPAVFWGCISAGIVPVCLNTLLTSESYDFILRDCRARVLVVAEELYEQFVPILDDQPYLDEVIVVGGAGRGRSTLADVTEAAPPEFVAAETKRDEVAFWLYSSGSTGLPKGVKHLHGSLAQTAHTYGGNILRLTKDDVVFSAAKLFFAYGLGNTMTFPLSVGATAVLLAERPTPRAVMEIIDSDEPTVFFGVPTLFAAILAESTGSAQLGNHRLRMCVSAGEALSETVGNTWEERFGVPILDGIGSTEMLHIYVSNRLGDVRYGWSGKPVPGYDVRIVDDVGLEVPAGDLGELLVSGPSAAEGYWSLREKNVNTFLGPWTRTGDKYLRDGDGYYRYAGRTDDMFKAGGNWVSPFEVESAIAEHDAVLEAAVIGRADDMGNLKPKAYVVLSSGVRPDEAQAASIKQHVKERLEPWKYPRWIEFVDELPKTATGKIQRFKLREWDDDA